jgi:hypothetical protein
VVYALYTIHQAIYNEESPTIIYTETPTDAVIASRPSTDFGELDVWGGAERLYDLAGWYCCVPFRLSYGGVWKDHPNSKNPGFCGSYGCLFNSFSPMGGYGWCYGILLLLQKLLTLWVIGTTISKHPSGNAPAQTLLLALLGYIHVAFLLWQHPYVEFMENYIQAVVHACQGTFITTRFPLNDP